ncbi:MAG: tRNA uridine-5-carboxymethylaminomethyl(34) synthesis GTPase MnmE [Betaproteobacteria bacterium]|nr:tRNA uridine-5-carboxymethylaminomethyl(34) synthesis GTPase MnmE [Betaproteobacteria bacterium]
MASGELKADTLAPDTVAAIATPAGRGGIGVVRVSGTRVPGIARALLGVLPEPRKATLATARSAGGDKLDQGIALYFPAPHSYTGEPVLEFQGHGGPVVMQAVLGAVLDAGARLAEPGEYTRRAFLNGRLDLAQAEAVADLIDAASSEAARSALRSLDGEFSTAVSELVAQLTELRALTEAMLDFPEEEVDELHRDDAQCRLASTRDALETVLARSRQGRLLREGLHVVIAGRPNVGKSSLLNRLAGAERAIVTPVAGTTRDLIREDISVEGVPLHVVDTAGLREAADEIEKIGIERARQEIRRADVVLLVLEALDERDGDMHPGLVSALPAGAVRIRVINKIDLAGMAPARTAGEVRLSAKTGAGVELLQAALLEAAGWARHGETPFLARERHQRALGRARSQLAAAAAQGSRWELFAEDLRLAQQALAEITGEVSTEDLLGEIFSRFCIGK